MEDTMNISDLNQADVLLFSGEKGSFISEAIMFLTDSPVSHTALSYTTSAKIIEETPPAVQVNTAVDRFKDRTIYVMRRGVRPEFMTPVLDAATGYLNNNEPYAMSNLYLVGALLIFKKFTATSLEQKIILKILEKIAAEIIDYINEKKEPGKLPMVCSQFAYQCYEDAGADYKLTIKDGVLFEARKAAPKGAVNLLEQAIEKVTKDDTESFRKALSTAAVTKVAPAESNEELARQLLEALRAPKKEEPAEISSELALAIHKFAELSHTVMKGAVKDVEKEVQLGVCTEALNFLKDQEAIFVAPGDLLQHCPDLKQMGKIEV